MSRRAALGAAAVAAATVVLFVVSRGKWSDAIVDSGIEWAYADALWRGELLYRDVVYWFGPFTPYFQAAVFRVFGSSFLALAMAGIAGSVLVLAALYAALRRVVSQRDALLATALAIPALLFMPNAGGAIIGMGYRIWHPAGFTMAAVALACGQRPASPWRRAALVGACAGLAALCRTEWGLIAIAGASTGFLLSRRPRTGQAVGAALVALLVFATGIGIFVLRAGSAAVLEDGHIFLLGVSGDTRRFLVSFSGIRDWPRGVAELVYSSALWAGGILVASRVLLGRRRRVGVRFAPALAVVLLALILSALAGGANGAVRFSAAPLVCFVALVVGVWRRGRPYGAAMAAFGLVGLLASHRRPFHIVDSPYVAPPLLFALICAAGLLGVVAALGEAGEDRRRLRLGYSTGLAILVTLAFVRRTTQYARDSREPLPGTDGMLSAVAPQAREIAAMVEAVRKRTQPGDGLVVFPEGQVLNQLTGRIDPLRHKLLIPGYLTAENESAVLEELRQRGPRALVLWPRRTDEYGPAEFGVDYGRRIFEWIQANYEGPIVPVPRGTARLYVRRSAPGTAN